MTTKKLFNPTNTWIPSPFPIRQPNLVKVHSTQPKKKEEDIEIASLETSQNLK